MHEALHLLGGNDSDRLMSLGIDPNIPINTSSLINERLEAD
jgi:hypothetical protein